MTTSLARTLSVRCAAVDSALIGPASPTPGGPVAAADPEGDADMVDVPQQQQPVAQASLAEPFALGRGIDEQTPSCVVDIAAHADRSARHLSRCGRRRGS